jgi:hypothetical protein
VNGSQKRTEKELGLAGKRSPTSKLKPNANGDRTSRKQSCKRKGGESKTREIEKPGFWHSKRSAKESKPRQLD